MIRAYRLYTGSDGNSHVVTWQREWRQAGGSGIHPFQGNARTFIV